MSFSQQNKDSRTNCPSSRDLLRPAEGRNASQEQTTEPEDDSLVEHILDFLDKYPTRFCARTQLTECA
jgi:hypothetical protein